ncbi:MAG: sulfurtransferase TusA family protein [Syntrophomonadaceae bacterium]|jgi:tRNA 2-thiouridine synthesizing protein A|nr:sulfurtransferase TusA family protein [Bacillota bacterium]NLM87412.1 SirA family protein [Syntrophomonadaceae bacterium]HAA08393.1 SirA family protein [Syntrophomonas sp.]HQA49752.1 sulfurtransferase TusA family protein [Syntrophomonadaceae bacterium]HQD90139.1 sulfurtransferase TusA family protein [Syntrophomonadaceae bacterium]
MEKVDVSGLSCPMPVIRTKKVMDQGAEEILVVGTSQVSKENVSKLAVSQGYQVEMTVDAKDNWEMKLSKK